MFLYKKYFLLFFFSLQRCLVGIEQSLSQSCSAPNGAELSCVIILPSFLVVSINSYICEDVFGYHTWWEMRVQCYFLLPYFFITISDTPFGHPMSNNFSCFGTSLPGLSKYTANIKICMPETSHAGCHCGAPKGGLFHSIHGSLRMKEGCTFFWLFLIYDT